MRVEVVGATGSGKTTVCRGLRQEAARQGLNLYDAWELLELTALGRSLPGVLPRPVRSVVHDALLVPSVIRVLRRRRELWILGLEHARRRLPNGFFRYNVLRNFAKRMAWDERTAVRGTDSVTLIDEGLLHQAHGLFVHPDSAPDLKSVERFVSLAGLPDRLVLVEAPIEALVKRAATHGHVRIADAPESVRRVFLDHALTVFRHVAELASRSIPVLQLESISAPSLAPMAAAVLEWLAKPQEARIHRCSAAPAP